MPIRRQEIYLNLRSEDKADEELDAFFLFLGKYAATFQWIESRLDQVLLLGRGHDNWADTQAWLATLKNSHKIAAVEAIVKEANSPFRKTAEWPDWDRNFEVTIQCLRDEGRHRNGIMHSHYLYEFVELGAAPLRSDRRRDGNFDREELTEARRAEILGRVTSLAIETSRFHLQLIHWYCGP